MGTALSGRDRKAEYREYLQSERWQALSETIKARSGGRCQLCNSSKQPLHTHHRTYANIRTAGEFNDLIALCAECHSRFHNLQEENSNASKDRGVAESADSLYRLSFQLPYILRFCVNLIAQYDLHCDNTKTREIVALFTSLGVYEFDSHALYPFPLHLDNETGRLSIGEFLEWIFAFEFIWMELEERLGYQSYYSIPLPRNGVLDHEARD